MCTVDVKQQHNNNNSPQSYFCSFSFSIWIEILSQRAARSNSSILLLAALVPFYAFEQTVSLAGDHLYRKWLFIWLSRVMSLMVSYFVLFFFPRDYLDEIWDKIESVPENFPTYYFTRTSPRQFSKERIYLKGNNLLLEEPILSFKS